MGTTIRRSLRGQVVLVTGGAGFIGSHLADALLDLGAKQVIILDNLFIGTRDNLQGALERGAILYVDDAEIMGSLEYIFDSHPITTVFNCATKALNYSFTNPANTFETNTRVAMNLLELQRKKRFDTLAHFSSSEVYGTALYEPIDEDHPRHPTTSYAAGKAAADLAIEAYVRMFNLDAFIVRPFNNYGPRQNYQGNFAAVIPQTVWRILEGMPPEIHGTGEQKRDFIYVHDTVAAALMLYDVLPRGQEVNISTNNCLPIGPLVENIARMMRYEGLIARLPSRQSDVFFHSGSTDKLHSLIQFKITPMDESLRATIDWLKTRFDARPARK